MPDRDFASRAVGRVWAPAFRLYVLDGATDAAADKATKALAQKLREEGVRAVQPGNVAAATARELESIRQVLAGSLFAPSRGPLVESGQNLQQIEERERAFLAKTASQIEHLARQRVAGVRPRRAARDRHAPGSVLSRRVNVHLSK